jgi:hypothetical protein
MLDAAEPGPGHREWRRAHRHDGVRNSERQSGPQPRCTRAIKWARKLRAASQWSLTRRIAADACGTFAVDQRRGAIAPGHGPPTRSKTAAPDGRDHVALGSAPGWALGRRRSGWSARRIVKAGVGGRVAESIRIRTRMCNVTSVDRAAPGRPASDPPDSPSSFSRRKLSCSWSADSCATCCSARPVGTTSTSPAPCRSKRNAHSGRGRRGLQDRREFGTIGGIFDAPWSRSRPIAPEAYQAAPQTRGEVRPQPAG